MQHNIEIEVWSDRIGPPLGVMINAIESCVHCGFCLPTCPTYLVLGEEMDSPRGRITLMKSVLEENLAVMDMSKYIDQCLDCRACVTVCPSGVRYDKLVSPFKAFLVSKVDRSILKRVERKFIKETLPYPSRFKKMIKLGRVVKPLRPIAPEKLKNMLGLLPHQVNLENDLPEIITAHGIRRARVALHLGCVQQVIAQRINKATINILSRNGVEIVIPKNQVCCGALNLHSGEYELAGNFARQNLNVFPRDVDAIISNAAGCGSAMKEYSHLFQSFLGEMDVTAFSDKVKDISEFLNALGFVEKPRFSEKLKIAYHDACHLAHAQHITQPPRQILSQIENLTLVEIPENEVCCGSAGTYNLEHPKIANKLGNRKAHNILSTGAQAVVAGNIGCMVQINSKLNHNQNEIPVYHIVELLEMAYLTGSIN